MGTPRISGTWGRGELGDVEEFTSESQLAD